MKRIAIFASGSGTNAENIIEYFKDSSEKKVSVVISNKKDAYVHERAKQHGIQSITFFKKEFDEGTDILNFLTSNKIDLIILAGFLLKIPHNIIKSYPNAIVNIHPALLPKYGGKGMYGKHVHQAVIDAKEKESGITIHYVDENYDEGSIIFQAKCNIDKNDTPETLAFKVHELEYKYFPQIIETL